MIQFESQDCLFFTDQKSQRSISRLREGLSQDDKYGVEVVKSLLMSIL